MDIAADLPAPRDDEPADLRRDIVDELADHLHCAVDRERQRAALEGDEGTTQNQDQLWPRVVARFGDPARIARRLWWDAMKEKIMSQRTQTATLVIMSLFCVAMMIVTLMALADSRELARDNQKLNQSLLAQLEELASRPAPEPVIHETASDEPAEWNQLTIHCHWETEDGPPAEGVRVYLESNSENTAGIPSGQVVTNAEGMADFGQVLYGTYLIMVTTPNGLTHREYVGVRPGQDTNARIACPEGDGVVQVSLASDVDWSMVPESIRDRTWLHCMIHFDDVESGSGDWWDTDYHYEWPEYLTRYGSAFEGGTSQSTGLHYNAAVASYLINEAGQIVPSGPGTTVTDRDGTQLSRVASEAAWAAYELPENPEYLTNIELPPGGYRVRTQWVVTDPADKTGRKLVALGNLPGMNAGDPRGAFGQFQGGSETGWGSGRRAREMMETQQFQLGALPFRFLGVGEEYLTFGNYQSNRWSNADETTYLVSGRDNSRWDIPAPPEIENLPLQLADLALRVPLGMDITVVGARITEADKQAVTDGAVVDLVWKGLLIQEDGSVVPAEHVLLRGVDVISISNQAEYEDGTFIRELYVPLTPEEHSYVIDAAITRGLWFSPSADSPRTSADPAMDDALLHRLRADSVAYPGNYPIDLPEGLRVLTFEAVGENRVSPTCDLMATRTLPSGLQSTIPILSNRLVQHVSEMEPRSSSFEISLIVTSEEEQVVSQLLGDPNFQLQVTHPDDSSSVGVRPFEPNPRLDEVIEALEALLAARNNPETDTDETEAEEEP